MGAILGSVLINVWEGPPPPPVKAIVELLYKPGQSAAAARILPNQSSASDFTSVSIVDWSVAHTDADAFRSLIGSVVSLSYRGALYGDVLVQDVSITEIEQLIGAKGIHPDGSEFTYGPAGRIRASWKIVRLS